ncbi:RNA polymerase II transcription factor B 52 kDa subunit [Yamadazyma tenuis]|uniref:RNA polymerase II transcription factor B subunit 2 n=1 Tax=Candida tenuis (strain ATCC 10573 / BCRC 21748 / CBS 615 / JCM 9827 / NBRC 10315 / NRRL Y-1498 / VKM Y-70) TaxID=590646 RepID=G3B8K8_CANTC|nr:transcription factor Tfb2 [Yamadazyma tenuis ATCC 10573]EGV61758.1 transcription factor Tfb2 [Yamadazyma tenuis ATCC 10573]WEJ92987.1 RNA polymerase II transcription factor B 52 kDa subunit [Yamadazyma tenuis]
MSTGDLFKVTVINHLESLDDNTQSRLYAAPATCLSIYRLLPPMAKFHIMSMLFYEKNVAIKDLEKWSKPNTRHLQIESLERMRSLHLVQLSESGKYIRLHPIFKKNFADCLTGNQAPDAFGNLDTTVEKHTVDLKFLDTFASTKWETILHYMVGTELSSTPSRSVLRLLKSGGLMEGNSDYAQELKITNKGFQFLLQDINAQIWTLLLQYLDLTLELQMDAVDVLNFIFLLGSLELGKSYSVSALSDTQIEMLSDLRDFGLVYQRSATSNKFYPTRLATTLTSDSNSLQTPSMAIDKANSGIDSTDSKQRQESIIIETNFKVYSYTQSPLEIAILNLFVHLRTRFANMVTGQITRESIRNALYNGITAGQVIKFLETHAHPQMKMLAQEKLDKKIEFDASNNINTATGKSTDAPMQHKLEILPPNVVDQIKLWQLELDRIQTFDGYLFREFNNQIDYESLRNYASEIGVLVWSDDKKRTCFVTKEGLKQVSNFSSRRR